MGRTVDKKTMCTGKKRYKTEHQALTALNRINLGAQAWVRPRRYYLCPFCVGFHLTSQP